MFIKVHLDFVHWLQVQLKGLVPKNRGHMNIYEHCDLRKEYFYAAFLDFWRRSWSSNWLMGVPIDFHWLQLTLLNPHDSLQVKWIAKIFLKFVKKFSNSLSVSNWLYSIAHDPALNLFEIPMLNRRSGFNVYLSSLLDKEGKPANILVKIVITNDTIIIIKDFSFDSVTSIDIDVL